MNYSGFFGKIKGGKGWIFYCIFIFVDLFFFVLYEFCCCLFCLFILFVFVSFVCGMFYDVDDIGKNFFGILVGCYIDENVLICLIMLFI